LKIWEVARAATAAPLFFEEFKTSTQGADDAKSVSDAGFGVANNPTQVALQELRSLHGKTGVGKTVSVGTVRSQVRSNGLLHRIKVGFAAVNDPSSVAAEMASEHPESYWRFEDKDGIDITLDEWKPNGIATRNSQIGKRTTKKIITAFNVWASRTENIRLIESCAQELVAWRRSWTADRKRWKVFATGVRPEDEDNGGQFTIA
jgi:hypothetical protein